MAAKRVVRGGEGKNVITKGRGRKKAGQLNEPFPAQREKLS